MIASERRPHGDVVDEPTRTAAVGSVGACQAWRDHSGQGERLAGVELSPGEAGVCTLPCRGRSGSGAPPSGSALQSPARRGARACAAVVPHAVQRFWADAGGAVFGGGRRRGGRGGNAAAMAVDGGTVATPAPPAGASCATVAEGARG